MTRSNNYYDRFARLLNSIDKPLFGVRSRALILADLEEVTEDGGFVAGAFRSEMQKRLSRSYYERYIAHFSIPSLSHKTTLIQ
jgi:hypothetical protein